MRDAAFPKMTKKTPDAEKSHPVFLLRFCHGLKIRNFCFQRKKHDSDKNRTSPRKRTYGSRFRFPISAKHLGSPRYGKVSRHCHSPVYAASTSASTATTTADAKKRRPRLARRQLFLRPEHRRLAKTPEPATASRTASPLLLRRGRWSAAAGRGRKAEEGEGSSEVDDGDPSVSSGWGRRGGIAALFSPLM